MGSSPKENVVKKATQKAKKTAFKDSIEYRRIEEYKFQIKCRQDDIKKCRDFIQLIRAGKAGGNKETNKGRIESINNNIKAHQNKIKYYKMLIEDNKTQFKNWNR